jgi:hypothetical protein
MDRKEPSVCATQIRKQLPLTKESFKLFNIIIEESKIIILT